MDRRGTLRGWRVRPAWKSLLGELGVKGDRVAVERNGEIVPRALWAGTMVGEGDRLEVVHFVGGGVE